MTLAADRSTPSSAQPELTFSYEIPDVLKAKLTEMHQKTYGELYEPAPPDATSLEEDIAEVLALLQQDDPQLGHLRLVWMALILAIAVEPTLKYYQPDITIPDQTIEALTCWLSSPTELSLAELNAPDLNNIDELVIEIQRSTSKEIGSLQTLYEAIYVYQSALKALDFEQSPDAVLDILESCLEGYAISPGSQGRQDLLEWWLTYTCPSVWCFFPINYIPHLKQSSPEKKVNSDMREKISELKIFPKIEFQENGYNGLTDSQSMSMISIRGEPWAVVSKHKCVKLLKDSGDSMYYFNGKYVEDFDEISTNEIVDFPVDRFIDDLCIASSYKNDIFSGLDFVVITRCGDHFKYRAVMSYEPQYWQEDLRVKKFLEILKADIEKRLKPKNAIVLSVNLISDPGIFHLETEIQVDRGEKIKQSLEELSYVIRDSYHSISFVYSNISGFSKIFLFDPELRHTYAQYLMYFGQFLEDLGINADTSVTDIDSKLVLKVQPKDSEEALENIHLALAAYLSLPSETGNLIVRPNNDAIAELKYQQLEFMIEHLRTQLKMSEATLRAQDVTIRAQEREISLLEMAASTQQLQEATSQATQPDSSESEYLVHILGLKITKYKGKFYEIDIPELIQRVERLLGKGKS